MELVVATRNEGKILEIREALDLPGLVIRDFHEFGDWPEAEETGETFEDNSLIKAQALLDHTGLPALADDSGLEVEYLGGRPGLRSSRYAGVEGDAEANMDLLLSELAGVPPGERSARFVCVVVLALPGCETHVTTGACEGRILTVRRGTGGFGYDPVFRPEGFDRTMAELTLEEKNAISHRGKALRAMRQVIEGLLR